MAEYSKNIILKKKKKKEIEINLRVRVIALFRYCCVRVLSKQLYHWMVVWEQANYFFANVVFPNSSHVVFVSTGIFRGKVGYLLLQC